MVDRPPRCSSKCQAPREARYNRTLSKLELLPGFRHRERNTHTAGLAEGRILAIADGITDTMNAVRPDLTRFERAMTAILGDTQRPGK